VGLSGVEPLTSRLSGARSNQLSYRPPFIPQWNSVASLASPRESVHGAPEARILNPWAPARERSFLRSRTAHVWWEPPETTWRLDFGARRGPETRGVGLRRLAPPPMSPRKEVIQPHLPVRLPCYDLAPITGLTLGGCLLAVGTPTSGTTNFRGLTGGVYKARERIHRCLLISDY
jgi:hypothetical protein